MWVVVGGMLYCNYLSFSSEVGACSNGQDTKCDDNYTSSFIPTLQWHQVIMTHCS